MSTYDEVMAKIEAVALAYRKEYEALAAMTGRTITQVEADLTAPDPCFEEEDDESI